MTIPKKIINFLEKAKVKYEPIKHRTVYTAFDKAQTLKVSEKITGKTLVVKMDKILAVVLISAGKNLDLQRLKKLAKYKKLEFVSEKVIKQKFKGVKVGAVPPFGNLWRLPTFIDGALMRLPKIIINSGDYNWSIKIKPVALKKLIPGRRISATPPFPGKGRGNFAKRAEISLPGIPELVIGNFSKVRK